MKIFLPLWSASYYGTFSVEHLQAIEGKHLSHIRLAHFWVLEILYRDTTKPGSKELMVMWGRQVMQIHNYKTVWWYNKSAYLQDKFGTQKRGLPSLLDRGEGGIFQLNKGRGEAL